MKIVIIVFLLLVGFGSLLFAKSKSNVGKNQQRDIYPKLRNQVFSTTPEKLGLKLSSDQTHVYGVVMDMDMSGETATVVGFETGDASIYLSTGGGYIGGYGQPPIHQAAMDLVTTGQKFLSKTEATKNKDLPEKGQVKFYLLTNHGVYGAVDSVENLESGKSPCMELNSAAQNVITQYRLWEDKQNKKGAGQ